ncbi:hypothetical protein Zm00014a_030846 [Zea mays]
MCIVT